MMAIKPNIQVKVAKHFDAGIFIGYVKEVIYDSEEVFYNIEYEDGDGEDFDETELQEGVALYKANQRMGVKIAKRFETGFFIGQVKDVFYDSGQAFYNIEYEDGDEQDFDEGELLEGVSLYQYVQKEREQKRKHLTKKRPRTNQHFLHSNAANVTSYSFGALYDNTIPIHTLILGTHPGKKSLSENRYFDNPSNAFWWIAGDCLGFRRDLGEKVDGRLMKMCAQLRYDESFVIPYNEQINVFCRNGFALWDIIACCRRRGSLDSYIQDDEPNDIKTFVQQHPTIKTIVMANGKSGLTFFNRYFNDLLQSGKLVSYGKEAASPTSVTSNLRQGKFSKVDDPDAITFVCAPSVSPALTIPYKEKRDFWDEFVYSPGLKLQQKLANGKKHCTIKTIPSCASHEIKISQEAQTT